MTHTTYETAKMLKEFLGESAPTPIKGEMGTIWIYDPECPEDGILQGVSISAGDYPAYQLHDLLSKPFCEAMATRRDKMVCVPGKTQGRKFINEVAEVICHDLLNKYYDGGLPAVEKALIQMMEGK